MVADLGSRVLIADRDSSVRQLLFSRLLDLDLFSDCVSTGREAMARLADTGYGVMVIDVAIEDGDAVHVIEQVALMPAAQRPVVLVLAERPEAARTLDVDIVQIILRKPVDIAQLAELVSSCVRSAARRAATAPVPKKNGNHLTS
jgi:DNA-binding NtrC family response regulator